MNTGSYDADVLSVLLTSFQSLEIDSNIATIAVQPIQIFANKPFIYAPPVSIVTIRPSIVNKVIISKFNTNSPKVTINPRILVDF